MGIYFVRHGQTDWNVMGKLQGSSDIELNQTGREQAVITREHLKTIHMDAIYCSPLKRAKETAEIINELWHLPIQFDDRLKERNFGSMEGCLRKDVPFDNIWSSTEEVNFQEGESAVDFFKRVEQFLSEIVPMAKDKNLLIVAHGGVSIPFQCYFDGYDCVDNLTKLIISNCEVKAYKTEEKQVSKG